MDVRLTSFRGCAAVRFKAEHSSAVVHAPSLPDDREETAVVVLEDE